MKPTTATTDQGRAGLFPESWCHPLRASCARRAPSFLFTRPRDYIYPKRMCFFSPCASMLSVPPRLLSRNPPPPSNDSPRTSPFRWAIRASRAFAGAVNILYHRRQFPATFAMFPRCQLTAVKLCSSPHSPPVAGNLGRARERKFG